MNKLLILILLLSSIKTCYPCVCKTIENLATEQIESYENNELIFIGEVISSDDNSYYKLRVVEILKGNKGISTIKGKSRTYCSLVPRVEDGLWLIYTNQLSDGTIDIPDCGLSRSFKSPYIFSRELTAPPPPPRSFKDESIERIEYENRIMEWRANALNILKLEIADLRKRKK